METLTAVLDSESALIDALWSACEELTERYRKRINPLWFIINDDLSVEFNWNTVAWRHRRKEKEYVVTYGKEKYVITEEELVELTRMVRVEYGKVVG